MGDEDFELIEYMREKRYVENKTVTLPADDMDGDGLVSDNEEVELLGGPEPAESPWMPGAYSKKPHTIWFTDRHEDGTPVRFGMNDSLFIKNPTGATQELLRETDSVFMLPAAMMPTTAGPASKRISFPPDPPESKSQTSLLSSSVETEQESPSDLMRPLLQVRRSRPDSSIPFDKCPDIRSSRSKKARFTFKPGDAVTYINDTILSEEDSHRRDQPALNPGTKLTLISMYRDGWACCLNRNPTADASKKAGFFPLCSLTVDENFKAYMRRRPRPATAEEFIAPAQSPSDASMGRYVTPPTRHESLEASRRISEGQCVSVPADYLNLKTDKKPSLLRRFKSLWKSKEEKESTEEEWQVLLNSGGEED